MASTQQRPADGGADKREQGVAMLFVGLAVLVADLLIIFFAPASFRVQQHSAFTALILVLVLLGAILIFRGRRISRGAK